MSHSLDFIDLQIGGDGICVEINEVRIGKNKPYMGSPLNKAWTLGGMERTAEPRVFLVVPDRPEATLLGIICTHVLRGSMIMTYCFRYYHNLNRFYTPFAVTHSETIKDPQTGAHTNSIEGTYNALKYRIPPRNRTNSLTDNDKVIENVLNDHLGKFE